MPAEDSNVCYKFVNLVCLQVLERIKDPLQTMISRDHFETAYAVLANFLLIVQRAPVIFSQASTYLPCFLIKTGNYQVNSFCLQPYIILKFQIIIIIITPSKLYSKWLSANPIVDRTDTYDLKSSLQALRGVFADHTEFNYSLPESWSSQVFVCRSTPASTAGRMSPPTSR